MAAKGLTTRAIEALRPRATHFEVSDGRGLALRVHPSGRKVWMLRAVDGRVRKQVRRELGEYPELGLAAARTKAAVWREAIQRGEDPTRPAGEMTVETAMAAWLRDAGLRSEKQVRRRFELHVLPAIGKRLLAEIELRDVARLLRELRHEKGLTAEANRVRSSLSALFTWGQANGEVRDNPVLATERGREPSLERERAGQVRVLDLAELVAIWRAAEKDSSLVVSALTRVLILVPLRREEWTAARWDEIAVEDESWILRVPVERMKGKRPHAVPLPQAAVTILQGLPRLGPYIFTISGEKPFAGWRKAAPRLSAAAKLVQPWTIHDIRRGVATQMGEAGIRESTIRRILAHSPRGFLGVTATYDKSERLEELRDALERWAAILEAARGEADSAGKVVTLRCVG